MFEEDDIIEEKTDNIHDNFYYLHDYFDNLNNLLLNIYNDDNCVNGEKEKVDDIEYKNMIYYFKNNDINIIDIIRTCDVNEYDNINDYINMFYKKKIYKCII